MEVPEGVRIVVLPGGNMPKRMSPGAIGYDVYLRALVSPYEMDGDEPLLRQSIFNFIDIPESASLQERVVPDPDHSDKWAYELQPGESVLGGTGFATEMDLPLFYWVAPRSGLASKHRITLANAPGTVDPDYRGEAGVVIVNESDRPFILQHAMRIAQIIFSKAEIVVFQQVGSISDLVKSERSAGGFGSTGWK